MSACIAAAGRSDISALQTGQMNLETGRTNTRQRCAQTTGCYAWRRQYLRVRASRGLRRLTLRVRHPDLNHENHQNSFAKLNRPTGLSAPGLLGHDNMAFDDTKCPCGDKKLTDTLLCDACETAFANHPSMRVFKDFTVTDAGRRHAAIVLVTMARGRKRKCPNEK
jgi:hypothetical protein